MPCVCCCLTSKQNEKKTKENNFAEKLHFVQAENMKDTFQLNTLQPNDNGPMAENHLIPQEHAII